MTCRLPQPQRFTAAASVDTGIHDAALTAGANVLGAEIDNRAGRWTRLALSAEWINASAAAAGSFLAVYLVHAVGAAGYEDGAAAVDPHTSPVAVLRDNGGTGRQRQSEINIPVGPFRFRLLVQSESDKNATVRLAACLYALER